MGKESRAAMLEITKQVDQNSSLRQQIAGSRQELVEHEQEHVEQKQLEAEIALKKEALQQQRLRYEIASKSVGLAAQAAVEAQAHPGAHQVDGIEYVSEMLKREEIEQGRLLHETMLHRERLEQDKIRKEIAARAHASAPAARSSQTSSRRPQVQFAEPCDSRSNSAAASEASYCVSRDAHTGVGEPVTLHSLSAARCEMRHSSDEVHGQSTDPSADRSNRIDSSEASNCLWMGRNMSFAEPVSARKLGQPDREQVHVDRRLEAMATSATAFQGSHVHLGGAAFHCGWDIPTHLRPPPELAVTFRTDSLSQGPLTVH